MAASTKSLLYNILDVTPCGSRFCEGSATSASRKLFKNKIFSSTSEKITRFGTRLSHMLSTR